MEWKVGGPVFPLCFRRIYNHTKQLSWCIESIDNLNCKRLTPYQDKQEAELLSSIYCKYKSTDSFKLCISAAFEIMYLITKPFFLQPQFTSPGHYRENMQHKSQPNLYHDNIYSSRKQLPQMLHVSKGCTLIYILYSINYIKNLYKLQLENFKVVRRDLNCNVGQTTILNISRVWGLRGKRDLRPGRLQPADRWPLRGAEQQSALLRRGLRDRSEGPSAGRGGLGLDLWVAVLPLPPGSAVLEPNLKTHGEICLTLGLSSTFYKNGDLRWIHLFKVSWHKPNKNISVTVIVLYMTMKLHNFVADKTNKKCLGESGKVEKSFSFYPVKHFEEIWRSPIQLYGQYNSKTFGVTTSLTHPHSLLAEAGDPGHLGAGLHSRIVGLLEQRLELLRLAVGEHGPHPGLLAHLRLRGQPGGMVTVVVSQLFDI